MTKAVVFALAVSIGFPSAGIAQTADAARDRVLFRKGESTYVFSRSAIRAALAPVPQAQAADPTSGARQKSWPARHPILVGSLIGAGVAAGMAGRGGATNIAVAAGVGAGAGALVTGFITASRQTSGYRAPGRRANSSASSASVDVTRVRRVVERLGVGGGALVTTRDGRRVDGRIVAIEPDRFVVALRASSDTQAVSYSDVATVRGPAVSKGVRVGLVLGVVGGIALGWLVCYGAGGCGGVS
jgi:hypothetical protein